MTGIARKTIRKYIKQYEAQRKELVACGKTETEALIQEIVEEPKYTVGVRSKRKLTEEIQQQIQAFLDENDEKRKRGQRKQLKKPVDIFEALEGEGIDISYSTVLRTVRSLEPKPKEAFIKGHYHPGDICEFDWGEVKVTIDGKPRVLQMAVFTSAYGNYRWAYLFTKQTTECFQEAHARFFEAIGGVYPTMVYDNMKVAVKRFVGPTEKEPTQALLQLSLYYGFGFRFCNVRRGNEKGHVERSVEVVRRKAFAFQHTFDMLEDAIQYLRQTCTRRNRKPQNGGQTAEERLEEERPYLLPRLPMFDAARIAYLRVDKSATIVVDQNHYSVPDRLVGQQVMTKIYSTSIQCFDEGQKVAQHARLTGSHEWRLELTHYLDTLKKKPGALAGSEALHQADQTIQSIYKTYYTGKEKDFIELLHFLADEASLGEVEESIQSLQELHPNHVTTDKIKLLCAKRREDSPVTDPEQETGETQQIAEQARRHLELYDQLFEMDSREEALV